jgi:hypothetical protein
MGRLKKYQTEEEKQVIKKQRAREYYWNNKEQEDEKARQRYHRIYKVINPKGKFILGNLLMLREDFLDIEIFMKEINNQKYITQ